MKIRFLFLYCLLISSSLHAENSRFVIDDMLDDNLGVKIYLVGSKEESQQMQNAVNKVVEETRKLMINLNVQNASGELGAVLAKKTTGSFMLSEPVAWALDQILLVEKATEGLVTVTTLGDGSGKKVKVNRKSNELKLAVAEVGFDFSGVWKGLLAEFVAQQLGKEGYQNLLVRVGEVVVARGADAKEAWSLPVSNYSDKEATKVSYYKAKGDVSVISLSRLKLKDVTNEELQSASIFANNAVMGEALARAMFKTDIEHAKKLIFKNKGEARAIFWNREGAQLLVPELSKSMF